MAKTRQEMIDELIADWYTSIREFGPREVDDILRYGFTGYDNLDDERLLKEYNDALGDME